MSELIDIAPGVLVATSELDRTNSVVLASIAEALLIDPSWKPSELDDLADQLEDRGLRVTCGISTHSHHDHLLWHPRFGDVPRYASPSTVRIAAAERESLLGALVASIGPADDLPQWATGEFARLTPTPHAPADVNNCWLPRKSAPQGFAPELITHDAHIAGHTAVWLPNQRILIAGDMLSDAELPLPDIQSGSRVAEILNRRHADPIADYLAGLDRLEAYARQAALVIPGHGTTGADAPARLHADRAYLASVLAGEPSDDPRLSAAAQREWDEQLRAFVGR